MPVSSPSVASEPVARGAARGLTAAEAKRRLEDEGLNTLPSRERHGLVALTLQVLREPMFLMLIGAATIYLLLGDLREALVLAASIVVVIAITVVQERRTERTLEALRDLSSPRALVIRDGQEARIAGREVVRGDTLVLREGDRVPADAHLHEAHDFMVDESLLTGESVPVSKHAHEAESVSDAGFAGSRAYSGTLVVRGTALGEVVATGIRSELGRIGGMLAGVESAKTSLERETAHIVRFIAMFAVALCVLVAALYFALRGDALAGVLAGLTLAMALLPEEFPVVLTVFLALGAWRIAKHGVLTRRLPAIEMLGAATVLCCDKTGTLTENRMTVVETWRGGRWRERADWGGDDAALLETAALACEPHPFDPMERAFVAAALSPGGGASTLEKRYPLSRNFLAVCHGWRLRDGERVAAMKGAPETVLSLCTMEAAQHAQAMAAATQAAARGLRLLGVARAQWRNEEWPGAPDRFAFRFLGFAALADPVRATVPGAIALCRRAGDGAAPAGAAHAKAPGDSGARRRAPTLGSRHHGPRPS